MKTPHPLFHLWSALFLFVFLIFPHFVQSSVCRVPCFSASSCLCAHLCTFCLKKKAGEVSCTCMKPPLLIFLVYSLSARNSSCLQHCVTRTRASVFVCELESDLWCTRNQVLLWGSLTNFVAFTGSTSRITPLSLSRTHRLRQVSAEVSQCFSTQSFFLSLPFPTSLRCSKNKIPAVKLTALRLGAFGAEANQKLERDARHAHSGMVDTFKTTLDMSGCSKVHTHAHTTQLKMQI